MARIYIGNLPMDVTEKDMDDVFYKFGRIVDIDLKTPARPPAFGFITFQDARDAEEAVRARDGYDMDGSRLRVEISRGRRDQGFGGGMGGGFGGGRMGMGMGMGRGGFGGRGGAGFQQTEYRVIVTGLPPSASWQDLKDHMRKAGEPTYTDVDHKGGGIVHFRTRDDMDYALRKLDGSDFRNPFEKSRISVLPHRGVGGGRDSRSRSRSPRRSRRARTPSSSRSRSRSVRRGRRGRSASRSKSRSPSRSPSRNRRRASRSRSRSHHSRSRSRSPSRSRSRSRSRHSDTGKKSSKDKDDDEQKDRSPRGDSAEPNGTANGKESNGDADHKGDEPAVAAGSGDDRDADGGGGDEEGGDKDAPMSEAPAEEPPAVSAEA